MCNFLFQRPTAFHNYSDGSRVMSVKYPSVMELWSVWCYEEMMRRSRRTWPLDFNERPMMTKVTIKFSKSWPETTTATSCSRDGSMRVDTFIAASLVVSSPSFGWPRNEPSALAASHLQQHRSIVSVVLGGLHRPIANLAFCRRGANKVIILLYDFQSINEGHDSQMKRSP